MTSLKVNTCVYTTPLLDEVKLDYVTQLAGYGSAHGYILVLLGRHSAYRVRIQDWYDGANKPKMSEKRSSC